MLTTEAGRRPEPGRRQVGLGLLMALTTLVIGLTGCVRGGSGDTAPDTLLVSERLTEEGQYSMAIPSLDALAAELAEATNGEIAAVVVPTDRALLALDADRLAELAGEGDLASVIVLIPASELVDLSSPDALEGAEATVIGSDGSAYRLDNLGGSPRFAEQSIQLIERRGSLTVIAIDGIIER